MLSVRADSRAIILLMMSLALISEAQDFDQDTIIEFQPDDYEDMTNLIPYVTAEEYMRLIHSMIKAYRRVMTGDRMTIGSNAQPVTKYRTEKRNADLINAILALPKDMHKAGR